MVRIRKRTMAFGSLHGPCMDKIRCSSPTLQRATTKSRPSHPSSRYSALVLACTSRPKISRIEPSKTATSLSQLALSSLVVAEWRGAKRSVAHSAQPNFILDTINVRSNIIAVAGDSMS